MKMSCLVLVFLANTMENSAWQMITWTVGDGGGVKIMCYNLMHYNLIAYQIL